MPELYARVGDAEIDDALALLESADSAIDRAMASLEAAGQSALNHHLEDALACLRDFDEELR